MVVTPRSGRGNLGSSPSPAVKISLTNAVSDVRNLILSDGERFVPRRAAEGLVEPDEGRVKFKNIIMYYVYLMRCKDGTIYTGITTNVKRRFEEHKNGRGGHYTSSHKVEKILYTEKYETRGEALKREAEIKRWHREKKQKLINGEMNMKETARW